MRVALNIPINRVEGDLEVDVIIDDGVVIEARSKGTLYRGFENILRGRDPLDALVITPRVCGICSVSHLIAAAKALEDLYGVTPPPQAVRMRNLTLLAETLQSDLRQHFLMYMVDFTTSRYRQAPFFQEAVVRYAPLQGKMGREILSITKDVLKIIAYIGGQWPHTSHVVPGGITNMIHPVELVEIRNLLFEIKRFLEQEVYGMELAAIVQIASEEELKRFAQKELRLFLEIAEYANLMHIGKSGYGFVSFGVVDDPTNPKQTLVPGGRSDGGPLSEIYEDCRYSYFEESLADMYHAKTKVEYPKEGAYSWAKAPRIEGKVFQTGALGDMLFLQQPLFKQLYHKYGDSAFNRQLARLLRPAWWVRYMEQMIDEALQNSGASIYEKPEPKDGFGVGLSAAARGALGHWIWVKDGVIANYQIVSPTTWNASPKDSTEKPGPFEKALLGTKIKDIEDPVEIGHIIRSFDPCLVCTVHYLERDLVV